MPTLAETKVVPESLDASYRKLRCVFEKLRCVFEELTKKRDRREGRRKT